MKDWAKTARRCAYPVQFWQSEQPRNADEIRVLMEKAFHREYQTHVYIHGKRSDPRDEAFVQFRQAWNAAMAGEIVEDAPIVSNGNNRPVREIRATIGQGEVLTAFADASEIYGSQFISLDHLPSKVHLLSFRACLDRGWIEKSDRKHVGPQCYRLSESGRAALARAPKQSNAARADGDATSTSNGGNDVIQA